MASASITLQGELEAVLDVNARAEELPAEMVADVQAGNLVLRSPNQTSTWWRFSRDTSELVARLAPDLGGSRLKASLPRSSAAGGRVADVARQAAEGGGVYRWRNGRLIREGARTPAECSGGGTEYTVLLCNVSIKISMTTGHAYAILTAEVLGFVILYFFEYLVWMD